MDFILINEEKIKIILSESEMSEFSIKPDEFDYSRTATKHIIWSVLERARIETGFNSDKSKLLIQVFSSKTGGCEIYITKFSENIQPFYLNIKEEANEILQIEYIILDFETLCKLCKRMSMDTKKYKSSLYYDEKERYFLVFESRRKLPSYCRLKNYEDGYPDYISEYGKVVIADDKTIAFFEEHYTRIARDNAIEIVSSIS